MILWAVYRRYAVDTNPPADIVIVTAKDREEAKGKVLPWLHGNKNQYIVTPLAGPDAKVKFELEMEL